MKSEFNFLTYNGIGSVNCGKVKVKLSLYMP